MTSVPSGRECWSIIGAITNKIDPMSFSLQCGDRGVITLRSICGKSIVKLDADGICKNGRSRVAANTYLTLLAIHSSALTQDRGVSAKTEEHDHFTTECDCEECKTR